MEQRNYSQRRIKYKTMLFAFLLMLLGGGIGAYFSDKYNSEILMIFICLISLATTGVFITYSIRNQTSKLPCPKCGKKDLELKVSKGDHSLICEDCQIEWDLNFSTNENSL